VTTTVNILATLAIRSELKSNLQRREVQTRRREAGQVVILSQVATLLSANLMEEEHLESQKITIFEENYSKHRHTTY